MDLSQIFDRVAAKSLVKVDLPRRGSNQHEINAGPLREFFDGESIEIPRALTWHYFADDADPISEQNEFTYYDSRAKGRDRTGRSPEWRIYYKGDFLLRSNPGDLLILAKVAGSLHAFVFQLDSSWARTAVELFDLRDRLSQRFTVASSDSLTRSQFTLHRQLILDSLGLALEPEPDIGDEQLMLAKFGEAIPPTKVMSDFAREQSAIDPADADHALVVWLEREAQLFYAIERYLVQKKLDAGFASVDDFVGYSLTVQNRRKSRMGYSLQNHLEAIFRYHRMEFCSQATTEGKNKPDFLFPGQDAYHCNSFAEEKLTMLAAKSSVKDRWRQILTEADRIKRKHLCTLDPNISADQTDEMVKHNVTLVIPEKLASTFSEKQRRAIVSLRDFISLVKSKS